MFREIVKDLYIGKSKLSFNANGRALSPTVTIQDVMDSVELKKDRYPDFRTIGVFYPTTKIFIISPIWANVQIFVTGIPKGEILDNFRLENTLWSSYYEDSYRGYLFQVLPINQEPKLIIDGSN